MKGGRPGGGSLRKIWERHQQRPGILATGVGQGVDGMNLIQSKFADIAGLRLLQQRTGERP